MANFVMMYCKIIRRGLILLVAVSVSFCTFADNVSDFLNGKGITGDRSAMLVVSLDDDSELLAINNSMPLIPASIMKCVTTESLLHLVNPDFRFSTRVFVTGKVRDGVLDGNLFVEGSGDPSLNSRHVADAGDICVQIGDALVSRGIKTINGKIVIDESVWDGPSYPSSWAAGDLPHAYGTASHGLNFEDNASGSRSVKNPAAVFTGRMRAALKLRGIDILDQEVDDGAFDLLIDHESVPIDEIMRSCMMRSDNQYAEALFRTFAVESGKKGSLEEASKHELRLWRKEKAPLTGVSIVDGSGLSRQNRVTADFMAHVLRKGSSDPYYASFFPLAGQEGTLKRFLAGTPLDGYVAMKTGSMNGIQCYAGYKLDEDYVPTHIIVVMLNELRDRAQARKVVENILLSLFAPESVLPAEPPVDIENSDNIDNSNNSDNPL